MRKEYKIQDGFIQGKEKLRFSEFIADDPSNYTCYRGVRKLKRNPKYAYGLVNKAGEIIIRLKRKVFKKDGVWHTWAYSFIQGGYEFILRLFDDKATITRKEIAAV